MQPRKRLDMQLDDDFFAGLGQHLTNEQKQAIAENVYSELEDAVGEKMAAQLSDEQYEQFDQLLESGGDLDVEQWLAANAPGHEQAVEQIFELIKQAVKADPAKYL